MKPEILFEEKQCFGKKSTRNFFIVITGLFALSLLIRFLLTKNREGEDILMAFFLLGTIAGAILSIFFSNCLITKITIESIYIQFPPFMPSVQQFFWKDIKEVHIITYKPITQYGGWGIRFGPYGRAYNIGGNMGLQIIFNDNSKLLVGTREPERLAAVLKRLGRMQ